MRILVACEFSGIVRDAFIERGHDAVSCDLLESERPGPHVRGDITRLLQDGWDLMVAFPPCTYLARSGAKHWDHPETIIKQREALHFVETLLAAPIPRIALENPPGLISTHVWLADQYIQPWQFGHGERKHTGLWLVNLPKLRPTNIVKGRAERVHRIGPIRERARERSRSYPGIAAAMADQWGSLG